MLCFFTFACIYNFCVEKTQGNCNSKCSELPNDVLIIDHLPGWDDITEDAGEDNTEYMKDESAYSNYLQIVLCDDSIIFTYSSPIKTMTISNYIETDKGGIYRPVSVPMKFQFDQNLQLVINDCEKCMVNSIILEATMPNLVIVPEFLTSNINTCKFTISDDSNAVYSYHINDQIKSLFNNMNKILEIEKSYYCISDKNVKCSDYSSYNPTIINSASEIIGDSVVLIVETNTYQIYFEDFKKRFIQFIGLEGSNIIYRPYYKNSYRGGEFHVIINENSIEMTNSVFEGKGSLTLHTPGIISLYSKTTENSIDFTMKTDSNSIYNSKIYSLSDKEVILSKKINVPMFNTFFGPENLVGFFEEGKYIAGGSEIYVNSNSDLILQPIEDISYYINDGEYEIPETWNKECTFRGSKFEESNVKLTFKNV